MWKALMILIIAGITTPVVKSYFDTLTDPVTGTLIALPTPDWLVVLLAAIPWIYPIGLVIYAILLIAGKDKPSV
jgi:hypothetical protein